jgi:hypothetical protein
VIRLLALILLALAVWRLLARRAASGGPVVTVARADGTTERLPDDEPRALRIAAVAAPVAP